MAVYSRDVQAGREQTGTGCGCGAGCGLTHRLLRTAWPPLLPKEGLLAFASELSSQHLRLLCTGEPASCMPAAALQQAAAIDTRKVAGITHRGSLITHIPVPSPPA